MKYVDEFRDPRQAKKILKAISIISLICAGIPKHILSLLQIA
jgi:hypothetical protein